MNADHMTRSCFQAQIERSVAVLTRKFQELELGSALDLSQRILRGDEAAWAEARRYRDAA